MYLTVWFCWFFSRLGARDFLFMLATISPVGGRFLRTRNVFSPIRRGALGAGNREGVSRRFAVWQWCGGAAARVAGAFLGERCEVTDGAASPVGAVWLLAEPAWITCRHSGGCLAVGGKLLMMWQSYGFCYRVISHCLVSMVSVRVGVSDCYI